MYKAAAMKESLVVKGLRWFSPSVFELSLDRAGVPFVPGDCMALFGADGRVSRPYSIASGNSESDLRFLIRRMPGGEVSDFLAGVTPGREVRVSAPFGWFRPGALARERPFVFLATGTGVAPFMSYLRSPQPVRPAAFLYGVRQAADLVDADWLRAHAGVQCAVSREAAPHCFHGRITGLFDFLPLDAGHDYYLCGLDTMIDELTARLEARGIPLVRIHRECFFNATFDR